MHHLHEMPGSADADVGAAWRAIDLGRHPGHHGLDARIRILFTAGHHARPFERTLLASRHAHADEADLLFLQGSEAAVGIGEKRVAAVDHDIVGLEIGQKLIDHIVDRLAGFHHDDDHARLGQVRQRTP